MSDVVKSPSPENLGRRLVSVEGWVVRVSSSATLEEAREIEGRMLKVGHSTAIVRHGDWYCVLLGNFSSDVEARTAADGVAALFPPNDPAKIHFFSSWCPRARVASTHIDCLQWSVRVSSTRSLDTARAQQLAVQNRGYPATLARLGEWYSVFAGEYVTRRDAERNAADIESILGEGKAVSNWRKVCSVSSWDNGVLNCSSE